MPVDSTFMNEKEFLSPSEYTEIVSELVDLGVEELRLTGGEPLLRPSFEEIVKGLSTLKLRKIGLTTNGIFLDRYLDILKANRVFHLNISLDSLDVENFRNITHGDYLERILDNVSRAKKMGFVIKITTVAMKGVNDQELATFVEYSRNTGLEVRFLELMRIGHARDAQAKQFIPAKDLIARLMERHLLRPVVKEGDSTSFNYLLDNGAQIGFIASESRPFCGQCSRWRLSADGILRACLMKDDGVSIKNKTKEERIPLYQDILGMKPAMRPVEVAHQMNGIGG
jgi:cyclic pyranopterin phosphate synthase